MSGPAVTLLGTGSPLPDPLRAGPATLVQAGGTALLVDCGRGVLMRLAAAGLFPGMLSALLLTHLHSDHQTDLNDVITTRWAMSPVPAPLRIIGPVGTKRLVERTLAMLEDDIGYRIAHHDDLTGPPECLVTEIAVDDVESVVVWDEGGVRVLADATWHRPVDPTIGFRIEHEGRAVVLAGDTIPCAGLDRLCRGADVYVQTVIRPAAIKMIPSARLQDVLDYHSSVEMAGDTAQRNGVGTLVLTHMVPPVPPGGGQVWIDEASAVFSGRVVLGEDLLRVEPERPSA